MDGAQSSFAESERRANSTTAMTSERASFRCEAGTSTYCWSLRSALSYLFKLLVVKEATPVRTELCVTSGQPLMLGLLKSLRESLLMDQTNQSITLSLAVARWLDSGERAKRPTFMD